MWDEEAVGGLGQPFGQIYGDEVIRRAVMVIIKVAACEPLLCVRHCAKAPTYPGYERDKICEKMAAEKSGDHLEKQVRAEGGGGVGRGETCWDGGWESRVI